MNDLDRDALRRGIAAGAALAVPLAFIAWVSGAQSSMKSGGSIALSLGALAALFVAAFVAARGQSSGRPLTHGLVAALGVFALVVVIRLFRVVVSGEQLEITRLTSNLLLTLIIGSIGAMLGGRARSSAP